MANSCGALCLCLCLYLSVSLSISMSMSLSMSISMSIAVSMSLSMSMSLCLYLCLVSLYAYICVYVSLSMSNSVSVSLYVYICVYDYDCVLAMSLSLCMFLRWQNKTLRNIDITVTLPDIQYVLQQNALKIRVKYLLCIKFGWCSRHQASLERLSKTARYAVAWHQIWCPVAVILHSWNCRLSGCSVAGHRHTLYPKYTADSLAVVSPVTDTRCIEEYTADCPAVVSPVTDTRCI
jgi:hypothetical protein